MRVRVVVVGGVRGPLAPAVSDYEARAARYWKLEVEEVAAGAPGRDPSPERVRTEEGGRIMGRLPAEAEVWALSRAGRSVSSRDLAGDLEERALRSVPEVALVVGGAFGLCPAVLDRAARTLSFSALTLPHEMARLVLAEQLYRAGTILRNEPYHKGA